MYSQTQTHNICLNPSLLRYVFISTPNKIFSFSILPLYNLDIIVRIKHFSYSTNSPEFVCQVVCKDFYTFNLMMKLKTETANHGLRKILLDITQPFSANL